MCLLLRAEGDKRRVRCDLFAGSLRRVDRLRRRRLSLRAGKATATDTPCLPHTSSHLLLISSSPALGHWSCVLRAQVFSSPLRCLFISPLCYHPDSRLTSQQKLPVFVSFSPNRRLIHTPREHTALLYSTHINRALEPFLCDYTERAGLLFADARSAVAVVLAVWWLMAMELQSESIRCWKLSG